MKRRRLFSIALATLCGAILQSGAARLLAQGQNEKTQLQAALSDLFTVTAALEASDRLRPTARRAVMSVTWLRERANGWAPRTFDEGREMRESIERMSRVLRRSANDDARVELLQAIADDLEDKVEYCRSEGLAGRRKVTVLTKRDGVVEVKGLEVYYIEKFLEKDPGAKPHQFRGFSSPAVDDLVPGRYVFWSRQPGPSGLTGARKEVRVTVGNQPIEVHTP